MKPIHAEHVNKLEEIFNLHMNLGDSYRETDLIDLDSIVNVWSIIEQELEGIDDDHKSVLHTKPRVPLKETDMNADILFNGPNSCQSTKLGILWIRGKIISDIPLSIIEITKQYYERTTK